MPKNTAVHNLLFRKPLPAGAKTLFGKGLKFCLRGNTPTNKLQSTIDRYNNDARRTNYWLKNPQPDQDSDGKPKYNPKMYFRSETKFGADDPDIEEILEDFSSDLRRAERRWRSHHRPNLTPRQHQLLLTLKNSDDYIVIEADKNLGVCILERDYYIRRAVEEHLGNAEVYKQITKAEANTIQYKLSFRLDQWLGVYSGTVPEHERDYLRTARHRCGPKLARFRMSCKLHKTPHWHQTKCDLKFRPIVACCGTWMNCWSKWLDHYLSKLTPFVPTYFGGEDPILDWLRGIDNLPPWAFVFTSDANSMYTNIDTSHAINVIASWLDELSTRPDFPADYPLAAVKAAMEIIMTGNHFVFGDLNFLQILGTAMGTSAACMWATIYYGYHESKKLLPQFKEQLFGGQLVRWIDDIFAIWCCNECKCWRNCWHWEEFQKSLPFGKLTWDTTEPAKSAVFLDLNISIEGGRIVTTTYQKPLNLYLYIVPSSNHSPKQIKAIIFQLMKRYRLQNTRYSDYVKFTMLLYRRHLARGHLPKDVWPYFKQAHKKLKNLPLESPQQQQEEEAPLDPNNLFTKEMRPSYLHFVYDKYDIPAHVIQQLHTRHCSSFEKTLGLLPPKVCYSRPKNIGDLATQALLHEPPDKPASYYMGEYQKGLDP